MGRCPFWEKQVPHSQKGRVCVSAGNHDPCLSPTHLHLPHTCISHTPASPTHLHHPHTWSPLPANWSHSSPSQSASPGRAPPALLSPPLPLAHGPQQPLTVPQGATCSLCLLCDPPHAPPVGAARTGELSSLVCLPERQTAQAPQKGSVFWASLRARGSQGHHVRSLIKNQRKQSRDTGRAQVVIEDVPTGARRRPGRWRGDRSKSRTWELICLKNLAQTKAE